MGSNGSEMGMYLEQATRAIPYQREFVIALPSMLGSSSS